MVPIGGNVLVILAGAAFVTVRFLSRPKDPQQSNEDEEDQTESAEGSVVKPVNLEWHSITCGLQDKSGKLVKCFLRSISGEAKAGRLLAIMGPSGAGKTTLLNVLAGQLSSSNRLKLSGLLYFNGNPCSSSPHKAAYVRQEDLFFSQLTVRETLSLAAELQLPNFMTSIERSKYVDGLLSRLGLTSCADTRVGDAKVRGISGGEKKRLSIACELIASPSIIFADEPTTGLDAFQAEKVMETLRKLAQDGHTVICSIHQPRGSIYSKFDDLVLLAGGSLVYAGPAQDDALTYFSELGYNCPEHVNPAEYFADLISIDYSSSDAEAVTRLRVTNLIASYASRSSAKIDRISIQLDKGSLVLSKLPPTSYRRQNRNWWKQFCLLLGRAWSQATRDAPTNKVRSIMSVASAIIFGSVFWRMKLLQTSIQDRMGLLQLAAINTAMAALTKTVNVFPKERAIVDRERAKGSYSLAPYLAAKLIAEMPISAVFPLMFGALVYPMAGLHPALPRLGKFAGIITVESFTASAMGLTVGAIAPTTEAAMALGPSLMTVFMVFGGYYINSENTPVIFKWIPRVSLIRWAFQALCINEFKGLTFDCKSSFDLQNGEQVIERLGFSEGSIKKAITEECRILLFWYCMTYIIMRSNKPRFKSISSPVVDTKLASEN